MKENVIIVNGRTLNDKVCESIMYIVNMDPICVDYKPIDKIYFIDMGKAQALNEIYYLNSYCAQMGYAHSVPYTFAGQIKRTTHQRRLELAKESLNVVATIGEYNESEMPAPAIITTDNPGHAYNEFMNWYKSGYGGYTKRADMKYKVAELGGTVRFYWYGDAKIRFINKDNKGVGFTVSYID